MKIQFLKREGAWVILCAIFCAVLVACSSSVANTQAPDGVVKEFYTWYLQQDPSPPLENENIQKFVTKEAISYINYLYNLCGDPSAYGRDYFTQTNDLDPDAWIKNLETSGKEISPEVQAVYVKMGKDSSDMIAKVLVLLKKQEGVWKIDRVVGLN